MSKWLKLAIFLLALVPLALMIVQILQNNLGPDPAQELAKVTGEWTIRFLMLVLALTPLRHLTGITQFVRHRRELRKHAADLKPTLAIFFELERRSHHVSVAIKLSSLDFHRHRFAVQFAQLRFRVERIDLRHATVHEKENDALGFGREMRLARSQRIVRGCGPGLLAK